jgi:hypothetical protein
MKKSTLISIVEDDQLFRESMRKLMTGAWLQRRVVPLGSSFFRIASSSLKPPAWWPTSTCLE